MRIKASYDENTGKMTVTHRGESREFDTIKMPGDSRVFSKGPVFATRFRTGSKLWPSSVTLYTDTGDTVISEGGYSNKGGAQMLVGWWEPESTANSQRN